MVFTNIQIIFKLRHIILNLTLVGDRGYLFLIHPTYTIPPNTKVTSTSNGSINGWKYRNLSKPVFLIVPSWISLRKQV